MIDSETKMFCLLGRPARHSFSPVMHNAGFKALKLNSVYLAFEPDNLKKTFFGLKEIGVAGFNLTMPFKEEIVAYLDVIDSIARRIGAVNTVVNSNGRFTGYNTDGIGVVESLKRVTSLKGKKVLLIGSGGAAKAAALYLAQENALVSITSRHQLNAVKLAKFTGMESIVLGSVKDEHDFDIIINATPVGMVPKINEMPLQSGILKEGLIVFDMVYDPVETALLKEAKRRRCVTVNGIDLLLNQGYSAFKLFTGKAAPKKEMEEAVLKKI